MPAWIQLLKNSGLRIETRDGRQVYIDPWEVPDGLPAAAVIMVTHPHHDHCSPVDVRRLCNPATEVFASAAAAEMLLGGGVGAHVNVCAPGDMVQVGPVRARAVEAFNVNKWRTPGTPFHPRSPNFLGWVLDLDRGRIYHAGDTDVIPAEVTPPVDVALIPVSGKFVATAEEAAEAVNRLRPALAIPIHYGAVAGSRADAERFRRLAEVPVEILD